MFESEKKRGVHLDESGCYIRCARNHLYLSRTDCLFVQELCLHSLKEVRELLKKLVTTRGSQLLRMQMSVDYMVVNGREAAVSIFAACFVETEKKKAHRKSAYFGS